VKAVLVISVRDNVATALEALEIGRRVEANGVLVTAVETIAAGHKIALQPIRAGEAVIKYGSAIGLASRDIAPGTHVHTHNVASSRGRGDLASPAPTPEPRLAEPPDTPATTQVASKADE
jgi:flagella basal body P-ring formation protein FlgA